MKLLQILLWIDIKLFWLVTLGKSRPGETISAAAWSLKLDNKLQGRVFVPLIDALMRLFGDRANHCQRAYLWQIEIYEGMDK